MNFTITRGDDVGWSGTVELSDVAYDLAGCALYFTGKNKYTDADASAIFQKTIGSGITVTNPTQGLFTIALVPADTTAIPKAKTILVWDLQLVNSAGKRYTIASGNLIVNPDVTNV
jgi:uncharacterized protein YbjT (DUF2867 family)